MRITADTNILLRAVVADDTDQAAAAQTLLRRATVIAVPIPVFCELAWVLKRGYGYGTRDIVAAIEAIAGIDAVVTDSPAVDAGLATLRAGGDFADGSIACQGRWLRGTVFASFDRGAVSRLRGRDVNAADPCELIG